MQDNAVNADTARPVESADLGVKNQRKSKTTVSANPPPIKTVVTKKKKQTTAFMYMGPNIPGGMLFNGSLYREQPTHLNDLFEKIPEVKQLIIYAKDVPKFKLDVEVQGSEAHALYHHVQKRIDEGALKDV